MLKDENMKKCIRMGITVLKIVLWGGKLLVLWSQTAFMTLLVCRRQTKFPTKKKKLLPQMTILSTVIP